MPNLRQQSKASNALNRARPPSATQRQDARFYHDPRLGLSQICWRTTVAHHPTEDTGAGSGPVTTFSTKSFKGALTRARLAGRPQWA